MTSDPIADLLIRIKNGYLAHKNEIRIPSSKLKYALLLLLQKEGLVGKVTQLNIKEKKDLQIGLIYNDGQPRVSEIVKVSKSGRRVYVGKERIPKVLGGLGVAIISTPKGLMTDKEARKKGLGGEIICKIW